MKKYRVIVIGCGRISSRHFEAIQSIPDLTLAGCADTVPERAQTAARSFQIPVWNPDYRTLLDECPADIVSVCTPSGTHSEIAIEAARRGFHVVTEKPMAVELADARRMIDTCEENRVHLFVVKQLHYNQSLVYLKKAFQKGRFGRIYLIQSNVFWQRPQSYYDQEPWRGTRKLDGGTFMNQASHFIDACLWLAGDVSSVCAMSDTLARNIETEDTGIALLRFKNGAIGSVNTTMLTHPRNLEGTITILGEKGTVRLGGTALNTIETWQFAEYDDDDREVDQILGKTEDNFRQGHQRYYQDVVRTLRSGSGKERNSPNPAVTNGVSGIMSLEVIHAIMKAAQTGGTVMLPLD